MLNHHLTTPAESLPSEPEPEPIAGPALLDQVSQFIGRYLQCSEHQRNLMALWCLHTHYVPSIRVTPYLSIQSIEKQSGKTLCLQLLSLLCNASAFTTGFTAANLTRRMEREPIATLLLDECQATLGTRARPKNPALRAILASGFQTGPGYTAKTGERNLFAAKAFAGRGPLPEELADRSLPIILSPLNHTRPNIEVERFNLHRATLEGQRLQVELSEWIPAPPHDQEPSSTSSTLSTSSSGCVPETLEEMDARLLQEIRDIPKELEDQQYLDLYPCYPLEDFPPYLSPRQRDMCEPLLQLADAVGGDWPLRIRAALAHLWQDESAFDQQQARQLLADLRDCFAYHGYPERLSTAMLLDWMHSLPSRPWDIDGPLNARTLAQKLGAFEIRPRVQRLSSSSVARGYQLQDFVEPWQAQLGFNLPAGNPIAAEPVSSPVTDGSQSEIPNKDKGCNTVTDSGAISVPTPQEKPETLFATQHPAPMNPIPSPNNEAVLHEHR
jgi:hypothetical protein